jgi:phospholipid/cholesterol/gamma-HCH transport system substrate-binding protein/paraquat-inducible protein B
MGRQNYFKLGLFVVVSVAALLTMLALLGGRALFERKYIVETYFNESISGLTVGSPVEFRGVPLGKVTEISIASNRYEPGRPIVERAPYVLVRMELRGIDPAAFGQLQDAVKAGLRIQAQLAGITGQLYLSLALLDAGTHPLLPVPWKPEYPYIPSAPSTSNRIIENVERVLSDLQQAKIGELAQNLNRLTVALETRVNEIPAGKIGHEALLTLSSARSTIARFDRLIGEGGLDATLRNAQRATARAEAILSNPAFDSVPNDIAALTQRTRSVVDDPRLDQVIVNANRLLVRLDELVGSTEDDARASVEDLRASMDNLRALTESARRYPAGLLLGDPPPPVRLPGDNR